MIGAGRELQFPPVFHLHPSVSCCQTLAEFVKQSPVFRRFWPNSLVHLCVREAGAGGSNPLTPTIQKPQETAAF